MQLISVKKIMEQASKGKRNKRMQIWTKVSYYSYTVAVSLKINFTDTMSATSAVIFVNKDDSLAFLLPRI